MQIKPGMLKDSGMLNKMEPPSTCMDSERMYISTSADDDGNRSNCCSCCFLKSIIKNQRHSRRHGDLVSENMCESYLTGLKKY